MVAVGEGCRLPVAPMGKEDRDVLSTSHRSLMRMWELLSPVMLRVWFQTKFRDTSMGPI